MQDILNTKHWKETFCPLILQAQISICFLCNHIFNYSSFQRNIKKRMENDELTMNVITMINEWLPETTKAQKKISSHQA